ncbi:cytochrome c nitrite reductase Fe-S protein [Aeromonas hydrophila]|uniref:cytochrome c nitrite reductase Fe-S protein n=1 Tax=Aeromonas hydrophila TaxID=644 RepID=UPI0030D8F1B7
MSCSRRHFMAGMSAGALIMMTGAARANTRSLATTLAHSQTIDGIRYGMIHDETACIGCTACMDACREVNQVPEGVSRLEIIRSGPIGTFPDAEYHFFRKSCQHCDNAPCVHVCPTGASHIRKEDGIVDVNSDLCVGCMYCLAACPYQVRFINPVTKVADKCDFCRKTNLAAGKEPACVESCPTKALVFGNLDDPDSPIAKRLVKETTYRYKQALGTSPKMYRVPKGEIKS